MKRREYKCGGHWTPSTTDNPSEFDCDYEPDFTCEECVVNKGKRMPKGIEFKFVVVECDDIKE